MEFVNYINKVADKFQKNSKITQKETDRLTAYEEVFKWEWFATKLKISSFVKNVQQITLDDIETYSNACLSEAIKKTKGLPLGFQNGIVSYNVLVSDKVYPDAISFVIGRPKKHFAAFEMPVIYDLENNRLYFYQGDIIWGMIYDSFIKSYLVDHFYHV